MNANASTSPLVIDTHENGAGVPYPFLCGAPDTRSA